MVTLDDLATLRPQGIDFEAVGHTVTIMPTAKTRSLGMGIPDVPLDWQVLADGNTVGYIEKGQDVILAWKPSQLDDGVPAEVTSIDEAVEFLASDPPKQQHKHNKHPHKKG
ncbi:hypothetical protein [Conyzicola sp.]|uniref:hypothetical protein n=1 Tax=Conyzicola sp. TaxID=1969404 RepID=UPI003988AF5B